MARRSWWSNSYADQMVIVSNVEAKIATYADSLGWTAAQVTAVRTLCQQLMAAQDYMDSSRSTMQSVTQWRDIVFNGEPMGLEISPTPTFAAPPDMDFVRGAVQQFMKYRDQIVANNNYTSAMGEDLMLIGAEITPPSPDSVSPSLRISVTDGMVNVSGSMQGLPALRMMYTPQDGEPREVAFITSTPAGFTITKTDPNKPENGELRAVFYKKNLPYGTPSPIYPVTLP